MKLVKKLSIFALASLIAFGSTACGGNNNNEHSFNKESLYYGNPSEDFAKYDNRLYNEYLMGEDVVIENQWPGYGIGDPFVMRWNGAYYLYCSTYDVEVGVRGYKSYDMINWAPMTGEGLREGYVSEDPVSAASFAPEVYYFNGTFYMYTSPGGGGHYVLTATNPEGPFVKATNNFGLTIDGSVLIDDDETMWFAFADNQGIRMAKMDDMLTVDASSTPVLGNTSIGGWTEGPFVLKRDGIYYLTYTGNHVASDGYRIAYSTADKITNANGKVDRNAWERAENNPLILETEGELKGIGHSSTVMGPDMDSHYIAYHSLNSSGGPNRSFGFDRLTFNGKQMSVAPSHTDSVAPALPSFYANGSDSEKFTNEGGVLLSNASHDANAFSAEFNVKGSAKTEVVVGYENANSYVSVTVDLTAKTIVATKFMGDASMEIARATLTNDFSADALHTVRIAYRAGVMDVVFDNMTKIDNVQAVINAGKIGYKNLNASAVIGYTALSNVAMGLSDQNEAKQAEGIIGASNYLAHDKYCKPYKLSADAVKVVEDSEYNGAKSVTMQNGEYATYLTNFRRDARFGLELVYRAEDAGKTIGVKLYNGTIWRCTLPKVSGYDEGFVKAIVGEFDAVKGITPVRIENLANSAIEFISFKFVEVSNVAPSFEASLGEYVERGVDYKTIWKIKDGGHYAKAGTRQLVYFGENSITDFTLEVDVKLEGPTATSTAGIVFHAKNYAASSHDNYTSIQGYYLAVNNNYTTLERLNFADGSSRLQTIAGNDNPFSESDKFFNLKIQVRGNNISVWIDGNLAIQASDANPFSAGKIGLYTNGAAVVFKNLKISA